MRLNLFLVVMFTILISACAGKAGEDATSVQAPVLSEGYYAVPASDGKSVPLVYIRIADGKTYAYSYFANRCGGQSVATFDQTEIVLASDVTKLNGPQATGACVVQSEIQAVSGDAIQVHERVGGQDVAPYTLNRVAQQDFTHSLYDLSVRADHFSVPHDVCLVVFGNSCERVELASK